MQTVAATCNIYDANCCCYVQHLWCKLLLHLWCKLLLLRASFCHVSLWYKLLLLRATFSQMCLHDINCCCYAKYFATVSLRYKLFKLLLLRATICHCVFMIKTVAITWNFPCIQGYRFLILIHSKKLWYVHSFPFALNRNRIPFSSKNKKVNYKHDRFLFVLNRNRFRVVFRKDKKDNYKHDCFHFATLANKNDNYKHDRIPFINIGLRKTFTILVATGMVNSLSGPVSVTDRRTIVPKQGELGGGLSEGN